MAAEPLQGGTQRAVGADEVAEQVQLLAAVLAGDLDAGDDLDRRARGRRPRLGHAAEGVVVGEGDGGEAAAAGQLDDLGRRVGAVAVGGVQVQVGAAGGAARARRGDTGR